MEKIDVKEFKGLYTNLLDNSANYSVFADMDKVKVNKRYLESQEYNLEKKVGWIDEKFVKDIIDLKIELLDDDRYWYEKNLQKYEPNFEQHLIAVTSTTMFVYKIQESGLEYINAFEVNGYQKSIATNGILKIMTTKGIYFLFYKRINNVKTLELSSFFGRMENLVVTSSIVDTEINNPKITFDIVATPMIYWLREDVEGTNLKNSLYRLPSEDGWSVRGNITSGSWYNAYVGTVYLVRPKHNTLNLQTKGLYDFDSNVGLTFVFIPIEIKNNNIILVPTRVNYSEIVMKPTFVTMTGENGWSAVGRKYKPSPTLGLPVEIEVNPETSFFVNLNDLHISQFNSKFQFQIIPENPYETVGSLTGIKLNSFFQWYNNPLYEHRVIGKYSLAVSNYGFEVTTTNQQIVGNFIQTIVFVDGSEVMIAKGQTFATSSSTRVIYGVKPIRVFDTSVVQTKMYIGFGVKPDTYELVGSKALYKSEIFDETVYFGYLDLTGILLANILAIYGDIDQFEYVKGGNDYCLVNNIGFLVKGGTVYYSPNDTSNAIFYKNRYIPNVYGDALVNIGGMLGIIRYNKDVTLISLQVIENEIYFKVYDTVGYVITGKNQYLEIPDGLLLSLKDGLYLVTPQERQLLSEPINDIFEDGIIPKLLYDDFNRRIMVQKEDDTYVFDLINKVWLKFKGLKLSNIAFDGNDIITIEGSSFARVSLVNGAEGYLKFHQSNLGSEKIAKTLCGVRIDLEGSLTMLKTSSCHYEPPTASTSQLRRVEEYYFKYSDQVPQVNMGFELKFNGKIYSMEILYNLVGEFPKNLLEV